MGLYDEAAEVLRESFTIKDDQIQTNLAGRVTVTEASFLDLLAPERRAGIYQPTSADTAANAKTMKALLAFNTAITPARRPEDQRVSGSCGREGVCRREATACAPLDRYMRPVVSLRNGIGSKTALELIAEARKAGTKR